MRRRHWPSTTMIRTLGSAGAALAVRASGSFPATTPRNAIEYGLSPSLWRSRMCRRTRSSAGTSQRTSRSRSRTRSSKLLPPKTARAASRFAGATRRSTRITP